MNIELDKLFPILLLCFFLACQCSDMDDRELQLEDLHSQISSLEKDNQALKREVARLNNDVRKLELEKEMFSVRQDEFNNWAKKLQAGYGTGIWQADETTYPVFVKPMKSASVNDIIRELNKIYKKNGLPSVILKKIDGTKVYVTVDDNDYLTQNMGSSGSSVYIQEIFFSITSVEGIECVDFNFEAGDHAVPGGYCK